MEAVFYWIGVAHVAAYIVAGTTAAVCYAVVWAHWKTKMLKPILTWYAAKLRWEERHKHGLSDAEWERGEPKP